MWMLLLSLLLSGVESARVGVPVSAQEQEARTVPKDSIEVDARGCVKGRVFTATGQPPEERTVKGPDITGHHFRLTGKKDVMDLVKRYNGQYVEVVGIVRRAALDDQGVGMRIGRGARVIIGAPGTDPTRMNTPSAAPSVAAMDLIAIRVLADRCPVR
jgi:hypothetical protein